MRTEKHLADFDHPAIAEKAAELALEGETHLGTIQKIFYFVRDDIRFGFTPKWDVVTASEVLRYGLGYCNTKATLFLALCRAAGIPARVHAGLIDLRIMHGILPGFSFALLPKAGGHAWVEVQLDGEWKALDSYINDQAFHDRAVERLEASGRSLGYSVAFVDGRASCEFSFGDKGFLHMGAVVEDHGTWEDLAEYFATDRYVRLNAVQLLGYPILAALANRNVERIRTSGSVAALGARGPDTA